MKYFLPSVHITDSSSSFDGKQLDVRWEDGKITEMGLDLQPRNDEQVLPVKGAHISQGWIDLHADFGTPGHEDAESLETGAAAALQGGFTDIAITPNTFPVLDNGALIRSVRSAALDQPIQIHAVGAATHGLRGETMSEIYDMVQSGAVAVSTDKTPSDNSAALVSLARYTHQIGIPLMVFPFHKNLSQQGWVHEGTTAIQLGLRGIPSISETSAIDQLLQIASYYNVPMHFSFISTEDGVRRIRKAKKNGIPVTADVALANLLFDESVLTDFDTRFKVLPPIRSSKDREALINGVLDGTIDAITSDHRPKTVEQKKTSFQDADYGAIGLEFCYPALSEILPTEALVRALTAGRQILGFEKTTLEAGYSGPLTVFAPETSVQFEHVNTKSKSKNSPLYHRLFSGSVRGVVSRGHWYDATNS